MKPTLAVLLIAAAAWFGYQHFKKNAAPKRNLAPPGVFFLTERTAYVGDGGVIGFPPGTEVRLVSEQGAEATVSRDGHEITVPMSNLTNDLDVAASIRSHDASDQARVSQQLALMRGEHQRRQAEQAAAVERENRARTEAAAAQAAARAPSALTRRAYDQREGVAKAPQIYFRPIPAPTPK